MSLAAGTPSPVHCPSPSPPPGRFAWCKHSPKWQHGLVQMGKNAGVCQQKRPLEHLLGSGLVVPSPGA